MKLTASQVRSISEPGKYIDQHGLILRVAPGGSKQWVWRGTIQGKRRDIGLGAVAYTPLAEAREIAFEYRRISRRGGDPRSTRTNSGVPTFDEAVEAVIDAHRGGWKNGRSETNWRRPLTYAVSLDRVPVDQPELGALSNLTGLFLGGNQLTGEIPPELSHLSNLMLLFLDGNHLTGEIPPELGALSNLTELFLHDNHLTGEIPPELGALSNLTWLALKGNQLTGCIPESWRFITRNDLAELNLPECNAAPSLTGDRM